MASPDVEKNKETSPTDPTRPETIDTRSVSDNAEEDAEAAAEAELTRVESTFEPPDGGLVAWTQVAAGNLVNMIAWGYPATFGVFQLYYKDWLQLPQSQISWIGSVQLF